MTEKQTIIAIVIIAALTAALRFLPFLVFSHRQTPKTVRYLGETLPFAVMGMLVVYCLKDVCFTSLSGFIPAGIASAAVVLSYIWKKNTLISIVGGTVIYMLLVQFVFV